VDNAPSPVTKRSGKRTKRVIELAEIPNSAKALEDALNRLVFAVHKGDQDGITTTCETIGLAFRRLVREVAELEELIRHQPKESVLH
jgi:hypothetical protein